MPEWIEQAAGVYTRRYAELDLTVGLVVGSERCLVVDTRGSRGQGEELASAVREVTSAPPLIVLTHAHFDHAFGAAALSASFGDCPIWSHTACRSALTEHAEADRREWTERYLADGEHALAGDLAETPIATPTRTFDRAERLDLGDRTVELFHPGPGHTGHDVVAVAGDVVFAGDLVEHAPGGSFTEESFGPDTHLTAWPAALDHVLAHRPRVVVPGHGDPVDASFVARARDDLRALADLRAAVRAGTLTVADAVEAAPLPPEVVRAALA
ncbi:Glyoxylase, beta-lactamase superfamily II [Prauserella aidingensis]|uniref:MBL fold metallo-hydrolase n=1 Tax=Prauserella aidingensis TaxID=387890 RepID=UPI0020A29E1E|nr:MBL fold metallo-hydrolase [Prauserella aidingensis]MCP2253320.1 Glyoxylase, beta-lactamase superfamily II [Prauserella aidingensis]